MPVEPPSWPNILRNVRVREGPFVQRLAADAERIVEALVRAGAVAVERDREGGDAEFGHGPAPLIAK